MKREEQNTQIACVRYFDSQRIEGILHHSPNGGRRSKVEGAIFKAMGVRAGFPDLIWITKDKVVFFELKSKGGVLIESQRNIINTLKSMGYDTHVIKSVDEFVEIVQGYLHNRR